ncbi:MAG: SdpI family protein [Sedimentisphaerales bacterium]|nr:SdpI family protein [Sedimentisphaerales bacterium]MBN2841936.1 SdpI family protein [Sedimentisphaerales bacterium]
MEDIISYIIGFATFFFVGLLFIALALPLVLKKVPPNVWYGWRTPGAYESDDIWYAINSYTGRDFLVQGIIIIIFNAIMLVPFLMNITINMYFLPGNVLILTGGTLLVLSRGFMYLAKIKQKGKEGSL